MDAQSSLQTGEKGTMKIIWLVSLCTLSALFWHSVAQAQATIDVGKIACNQFMFGNIAESRTISIWLNGFYNGRLNNTIIDVATVQERAQDVVRYCMDHPNLMLMDAAISILSAKK
jgi:HdeA/HdeB family